jgi:uncharacterized membrane protein
MTRKEFIKSLRAGLTRRKINADDAVECYEELIAAKIDAGASEAKAVKSLGEIDDIVREIDVDKKLDAAVERPSLSTGAKALIATLGVLSLPILLPVAVAVLAILLSVFVVIFSFMISAVAVAASVVFAVVALIAVAAMGQVGFEVVLFALGVGLIIIPLSIEAVRGLVWLIRALIGWLAGLLKRKQAERKGAER